LVPAVLTCIVSLYNYIVSCPHRELEKKKDIYEKRGFKITDCIGEIKKI